MTTVIVDLFVEVHPSQAKQTLSLDGNCFLLSSTVSEYSHQQMLPTMLAGGSTNSLRNTLYDYCSSRFGMAFYGIQAETNPNMQQWLQVRWWNSAISKSFAASVEHFVCQFSQYKYNLTFKYECPLETYEWNSSTSLSLQYGQSCFIDCWISQFCNFRLCQCV